MIESEYPSRAADRDQRNFTRLPRFESDSGAWSDVQAQAVGNSAVKHQRRIGFGEMVVRAHLDRTVASGLLALIFGWLAFRSRVTGVYLSILTQAMTLALALHLLQNDSGLRGNNGLSGLQNLPGITVSQDVVSVWFLWASALALGLGYMLAAWIVSGNFGSVVRGIRDNEARVQFLGYSVERYKLVVFTLTACIAAIAGALYFPQAGIINLEEMASIASIYLAVWVAIGGRGRLYGAVIGAVFVSLLSTWFTGGQAPDIPLCFYTIKWVDWWQVLLGVTFVLVTLFTPQGIGGLFDLWTNRRHPDRHGANLGPGDGSLREREATE